MSACELEPGLTSKYYCCIRVHRFRHCSSNQCFPPDCEIVSEVLPSKPDAEPRLVLKAVIVCSLATTSATCDLVVLGAMLSIGNENESRLCKQICRTKKRTLGALSRRCLHSSLCWLTGSNSIPYSSTKFLQYARAAAPSMPFPTSAGNAMDPAVGSDH